MIYGLFAVDLKKRWYIRNVIGKQGILLMRNIS